MKIDIPIYAIDFEGSKSCGIVEFGAVEILNGEISRAFTSVCAPHGRISKAEERLFNINEASAAQCAPFESHLPFFANLRANGIFAAHHSPTEDAFLRYYAPSCGQNPYFLENGKTSSDWGPWIDTCVFVKNICAGLKSAKLEEAVNALGIKEALEEAAQKYCPKDRRAWHCALYDALASALIITSTGKRAGFENMSLEWLAKFAGVKNAGQGTLF